jgi:hypothetical protein
MRRRVASPVLYMHRLSCTALSLLSTTAGGLDQLSDADDLGSLISALQPNVSVYTHIEPTYQHLDFTCVPSSLYSKGFVAQSREETSVITDVWSRGCGGLPSMELKLLLASGIRPVAASLHS